MLPSFPTHFRHILGLFGLILVQICGGAEAELSKRAGVGGGSGKKKAKKSGGGFAPYAALSRESRLSVEDDGFSSGDDHVPAGAAAGAPVGAAAAAELERALSSDQIMQHHRRSSMSGSESETEGGFDGGSPSARAKLEAHAARP